MTNADQQLDAALALYQAWFWAPNCTRQYATDRLFALGFVWDGAAWQPPSVEVFVQRVMGGPDYTMLPAAEYVRGIRR